MQGLTDRIIQGLSSGQHPCLYCGQPALIQVRGEGSAGLSPQPPYPFWIHLQCPHCGRDIDANGDIPSVDQLVYWSHPRTRQFVHQHPRWQTTPGRSTEYNGTTAIQFQIADVESSEALTILVHRDTLRTLELI